MPVTFNVPAMPTQFYYGNVHVTKGILFVNEQKKQFSFTGETNCYIIKTNTLQILATNSFSAKFCFALSIFMYTVSYI